MKTILEIITFFYSHTYSVIWRRKKKGKYTYKYLYNAYVCVPEDDIES